LYSQSAFVLLNKQDIQREHSKCYWWTWQWTVFFNSKRKLSTKYARFTRATNKL